MSINSQPLIYIDPKEEIRIVCRILYYRPQGYYRTAEKLRDACQKAGHDFAIADIRNWLDKQSLHQIHKPRPKFIPCASFNSITIPMEVIQADLCYMPHDKIKRKTYKFALNCVDIASRTKWTYPLCDRDSASVAKGLKWLFSSRECPLTWPKLLIVDKGSEFRKEVIDLMNKHGVKIQLANSKETMGVVERFNKTLQEWAFRIQDAVEMRLPPTERCRAWIKNLPIFLESLDNTVTRLIGMSPVKARKRRRVYAKSSKPRDVSTHGVVPQAMGFDEERLTHNDLVRHLLKPGELEGGRRRATDCNWSPQIYHVKESLVQKNQPVLYRLEDEDANVTKRSFVREELMVIPHDTELPPNYILRD